MADYFETADGGGVVLGDGSRVEADVVVSADGLGTKSNKLVNNGHVRAMASGHSIFRTAYPVELALADPEAEKHFPLLEGGRVEAQMWSYLNI